MHRTRYSPCVNTVEKEKPCMEQEMIFATKLVLNFERNSHHFLLEVTMRDRKRKSPFRYLPD